MAPIFPEEEYFAFTLCVLFSFGLLACLALPVMAQDEPWTIGKGDIKDEWLDRRLLQL